jgi:hypothetical protein
MTAPTALSERITMATRKPPAVLRRLRKTRLTENAVTRRGLLPDA